MKKKINNILTNSDGVTMTEVLVGFVIITMAFAMFSGILTFSSNMLIKFHETQSGYDSYQEKFLKEYKNTDSTCVTKVGGISFQLEVDSEKTDPNNRAIDATIELENGETDGSSLYFFQDGSLTPKQYFFKTSQQSN